MLTSRGFEAWNAVANCKGSGASGFLEQGRRRSVVEGRLDGQKRRRRSQRIGRRLRRAGRRKVQMFRKSQMMVPAHDLKNREVIVQPELAWFDGESKGKEKFQVT